MTRRLRPRKPLAPDSTPLERSLDALALRRRGYSLRRAADLARTDPRTVRRHAGSALRKEGGRWVASPFDRIPREMTVLTPSGPEVVIVRDSRTASLLAEHANAVAGYIERGDEAPLRRLRRRSIQIRGQPVVLATDPVRLDRLAAGGELHYELYRH
jgi:hypothetical protein